jgi:hypothetical protein
LAKVWASPANASASFGSILSACSNKARADLFSSIVNGHCTDSALPRIVRSMASGFFERAPFSASALTSSLPKLLANRATT